MYKSKTNKIKNIVLELIAWSYAVSLTLLSMTVGLIFGKSRDFISYLYKDYLSRKDEAFWRQYLSVLLNLPKIFIWDRFLSTNRTGGLAVRMIYKYFGCMLPVANDIGSVEINQIVEMPSDGFCMAELDFSPGNTSVLELAYLSQIVRTARPKRCLEIGTFNGRSTLHIALNAPGAEIYTIDLENDKREPTYQNIKLLFDKDEFKYLRNRVKTLYGDTKEYNFDSLGGSFDFIFVDGNHREDYVINDSHIAFKLIKKGGTIVWHDYIMWDDVTMGLDKIARFYPDTKFYYLKMTSLVMANVL